MVKSLIQTPLRIPEPMVGIDNWPADTSLETGNGRTAHMGEAHHHLCTEAPLPGSQGDALLAPDLALDSIFLLKKRGTVLDLD